MFIRSERLFLRPGWAEDWEQVYAGIADEAVVRNLAKAPWPYKPEHAQSFLAAPRALDRYPNFLVTLAEDGRVIGGIGLHLPDEDGRVELGYWFAQAHWGRGYATEAARAVVGLARTLGHCRLHAGRFVDNPASGRVLVKAGFRPTGRIARRFCVARGHEVDSVEYTAALSDCGDGDGGDTAMFKRAA